MEEVEITKINRNRRFVESDVVAMEVPFTINLNGSELVTLLSSPEDLRELAAGFLFSSGLVKKPDEIETITIDQEKWLAEVSLEKKEVSSDLVFKRMYTSGCGRGTLFYSAIDLLHRHKNNSSLKIEKRRIFRLMSDFQNGSTQYKQTGGVHYAALSDGKVIIFIKEDVGRHNAVDKVIGCSFLNGFSFDNTIFLTSGRVSSEIVLKIQKTGSPMLISRSAPTNQGVRLARDLNLTLIGFVRGQRMNIYSASERVLA
ncbi:MAG: formate dehydrogenase accessory sulfurtransferase FdhD [Candidatus Glassbacteria bacterium]